MFSNEQEEKNNNNNKKQKIDQRGRVIKSTISSVGHLKIWLFGIQDEAWTYRKRLGPRKEQKKIDWHKFEPNHETSISDQTKKPQKTHFLARTNTK